MVLHSVSAPGSPDCEVTESTLLPTWFKAQEDTINASTISISRDFVRALIMVNNFIKNAPLGSPAVNKNNVCMKIKIKAR